MVRISTNYLCGRNSVKADFVYFLDLSSFKFPSLEPETEQFLLRKKADLEFILVNIDKGILVLSIFSL